MKLKKFINIKLIGLLVLFVMCEQLQARHIIGGDVTYRCVASNATRKTTDFKVDMYVYRDTRGNGAPFDSPAEIGIYRRSGLAWTFVRALNVNLGFNEEIKINNANPCVIVPTNLGAERGYYTFDITLDWGADYQIVYQRCCRNNTINNIADPGDQGAAFSVEISQVAIENCNNSPTFKNFPPVLICLNRQLNFDHGAADRDGDSLVYEFCSPNVAGGTLGTRLGENERACNGVRPSPQNCRPPYQVVNYIAPYTVSQPMGGNPVVTIDPKTGVISGIPKTEGQFVIGICVKEFRNGVKIGEIQRDFQFNVTGCENAFNAEVLASDRGPKKLQVDNIVNADTTRVRSCGGTLVFFQNTSVFKTSLDATATYQWQFNPQGKVDTYNVKDLLIDFPKLGRYNGRLIINPDKPDCSDTAEIIVNVYPRIDAQFTQKYDTCVYGPVSFTNNSIIASSVKLDSLLWNFNNEGNSKVFDPVFEFTRPGIKRIELYIKDNNQCFDTLTNTFPYQPAPTFVDISPDRFIACEPGLINFTNRSRPIDNTYDVSWQMGDGTIKKGLNITHTYTNPGIYDIKVSITSPIKCFIEKEFPSFVEIRNSPEAGFDYNPKVLNAFERTVDFTDLSVDGESILWRFGNEGGSTENSPTFTFPDTGIYRIIQTVLKSNGCQDTAMVILDVAPVSTMQVPNAFTPNNDNLNDDFRVKGLFGGITNFTLKIYNRYGEKIFETDNPNIGWDGTKGPNQPAQPDVYVYLVNYTTPRGESKALKGHFTLIK